MSAQLHEMVVRERELDARTLSDGTRIRLLWLPADGGIGDVLLEAWEPDGSERLQVAVPPAEALDAFNHPWLHLPPRPPVAHALDDEDSAAA